MNRVLLAVAVLSLFCGSSPAGDPVYFADSNLKSAVEAELWVLDPTPTDMQGLTSLDAPGKQIADLTGLEYATNLQTLVLWSNQISNLWPLSGLTNLETLVLNNNHISDTSALSGLSNLLTLDMHENQISDISALSGLTRLKQLTLRLNQISDLSALSGLADLHRLDLLRNQISDISGLSTLTSLGRLDLRVNPLNEEAYDLYIPLITTNNPGIYFSHDPRVAHRLLISSAPGGSVIRPGEGEFLYAEGELVTLEAEADPGFVFVDFGGSCYATENPARIVMDDDHEIQANFVSVMNTLYVDDNAPDDRAPGDATVSDPQEDGTPEHPFDMIQEAIDVATDGISVIVRPGVYHENIDFLGKNIRLQGIDWDDPNPTAYPVITGDGAGPIVRFANSENLNCMLTGFVITGGRSDPVSAIFCQGGSPTLSNCLIAGNRSTDPNGTAVYCASSHAALSNCTITDNMGGDQSAGITLVNSSLVVTDSILWGNAPTEILLVGTSKPSITYTDITGGWLDLGNIDADPLFAQCGYWAEPGDPNEVVAPDDPNAIWIDGDYRLQSQAGRWDPSTQTWVQDDVTSPCIDAGNPMSPVGLEPLPNGGIINMGAYGGTGDASLGR